MIAFLVLLFMPWAWATYEHDTLADLEIWVLEDDDDTALTAHPLLQVGRQHVEGKVAVREVDDTAVRFMDAIPDGYTAAA